MNAFRQASPDEVTAAPTTAPAQASGCGRILVVEDDNEIRDLNVRTLARAGYRVDAAADGAAGWDALHASSYDLLLTDQNMPKLTGVELVKLLRSAQMSLAVILATGALPTEELRQYPWLRLAATLQKPYSCDELLDTVKDVLRMDSGHGGNGGNGGNGDAEGSTSRSSPARTRQIESPSVRKVAPRPME